MLVSSWVLIQQNNTMFNLKKNQKKHMDGPYEPGSKLLVLGMVIPPLIRESL